ncbi:hypothetical protein [Brachybacterium sp. Marseille-Q7125]|uniref:hypothetical protein n=1 Tax=Brachybacterium sp. Marseille-Q7125 TaxID=2932815 RepID=UPI001FF19697|nr:hypothetical protein [Brachybacterium sp. Marseille-Q7125]
MLASLATSDREIAASLAGAQLDQPQGATVPVAVGGETIAHITLVQIPNDDHGEITEDSPWTVEAIDLLAPPENTALPLAVNSSRQIAAALQPSLAAVITQPAGLTDEDRTEMISAGFTDPDLAYDIPRGAGPEERIVMGNVHDVQLTATSNGDLAATVVVPWVIDNGENVAQWTTLTVTLTRADDGTWTAADATTA